jgi:hypothetical protein
MGSGEGVETTARRRWKSVAWLSLVVSLVLPKTAAAEWQLKPFLGLTFGGGTTFVDPEHASGSANVATGVSGEWLGEVLGVNADLGWAPGFFQRGGQSVLQSSVTTLTGNVVVALPRRLARYTLRPYVVGGTGLMHARLRNLAGGEALDFSSSLSAVDFGGGVTGFLTDRIGLNWEGRWFRTTGGKTEGVSLGPEELSFWRASMALAIKL